MNTRQMCSWCHTLTDQHRCPNCGHDADVPRAMCVCAQCTRWDRLASDVDDGDYIADRVAKRDDTPPNPYE